MNNNFIAQFSKNIKFSYTSFDRVILLDLFYEGGVASFLKSMGFVKRSNGVMRIFTNPPANRLDIQSFKGLIDIALLSLVNYLILLVRHWRAGTTINNSKSLGLKKPVLYLQAYLWKGFDANNKFLNCCADVDLSSLCEVEPDMFSKPVLDHLNHKVLAPDLRKDRQLALIKELLKTKYSSFGFKTSELKNALFNYFRNSSQIRYELKKLISRKIVKKAKGKSFYTVTKFGCKWLWTTICANDFFKNPIISRCFKKDLEHSASQPSNIEKSYLLIYQGLTLITQELAMI